MRNLIPIADDPLDIYDGIVGTTQGARRTWLIGMRATIVRAYRRFRARRSALERLGRPRPRPSVDQAGALLHCYKGATDDPASSSPRDRLYVAVRRLSDDCAYCGASTTSSLDHYLAKETFPEFAIFPLNLVPSCAKCNTPRPIVDAARRRALLHPYFDTIPNEPLLIADIQMVGGQPRAKFTVAPVSTLNPTFRDLYERHCGLLGLLARYARRAERQDLAEIRRTIRVWGEGRSRSDIKTTLKKHAEQVAADDGPNSMKAALFRAAEASDPFVDYCLQ